MTRFHGIIISYAFWCNKTPIDWIFGWQQLNCYPGHQLLPLVSPLPIVGVAGKNKLAVALIRVNKCIIISKKGKLALCNSAPPPPPPTLLHHEIVSGDKITDIIMSKRLYFIWDIILWYIDAPVQTTESWNIIWG